MAVSKTTSLLVIVAVLLKIIHGASQCSARQKDGSICPRLKHIKIHYKPYYEIFFDKTGSRNSLYPDILRNASKLCCNSSVLDFLPVNGSHKDIEELMEELSCAKAERNDSGLSFFFPVYVKSGKKVVFDEQYPFVELAKSPGPVIMMLTSEKQKMKVTASVAVRESWPLFVLILCLSATVGALGWLLVCILTLLANNPFIWAKLTKFEKLFGEQTRFTVNESFHFFLRNGCLCQIQNW
jgi:hypothetical protein